MVCLQKIVVTGSMSELLAQDLAMWNELQALDSALQVPAPPSMPQTTQPTQECTAAQQAAGQLGSSFESVSRVSGALGFATGIGTVVAGAGEGITFGGDTPVTLTFGSMTGFFGTASFVTGAGAAALNSFANGNMAALGNFNYSHLADIAVTAAASRVPGIASWAEIIGHLAEQGTAVSLTAQEACP